MILRMAAVIVGGLAAAGFVTLATAWYARSLMSADANVRRRVQLVEALMGFAMLSLWAATAQNARERKLALMLIGVIAAAWLFRGAKLLLTRRRT
jgi:hypothetical protein